MLPLQLFHQKHSDRLLYLKQMENLTTLREERRRSVLTSHKLKPLDRQVGGNHYKDMKIQPVEFILANDLGFCEGNVVKYICRYKQKGGVEDLEKVIHYTQMLIDKVKESKDGR